MMRDSSNVFSADHVLLSSARKRGEDQLKNNISTVHHYLVRKRLTLVRVFIESSMEQFMQWADHVQNVG